MYFILCYGTCHVPLSKFLASDAPSREVHASSSCGKIPNKHNALGSMWTNLRGMRHRCAAPLNRSKGPLPLRRVKSLALVAGCRLVNRAATCHAEVTAEWGIPICMPDNGNGYITKDIPEHTPAKTSTLRT